MTTKISKRDDFSLTVKRTLAERAGLECSCPTCSKRTKGPESNSLDVAGLGKAAHIISASPCKGPRADPSISPEYRKSIDNGIWLCSDHAAIIDSDENKYPPELLRIWKIDHEEKISLQVSGVWVGNGILKEAKFGDIAHLAENQHITFGRKTLILGKNGSGKTVLCDFIALLGRHPYAKDRLPLKRNNKPHFEITTFSYTIRKWRFEFSDSVSIFLENILFPSIFSGFNVIYCRDPFEGSGYRGKSTKEKYSRLLKSLGRYLGYSAEEISSVIQTFLIQTPIFLEEIRLFDGVVEAKTKNTKGDWCAYYQLSSAEQQLFVLDLVLRTAKYSAETIPTVLIFEQAVVRTLDESWKVRLLDALSSDELPFQIILTMHNWPTDHSFNNWRVWELRSSPDHGGKTEVRAFVSENKRNV